MKCIAITGASGFIGGRAAQHLSKKGYEVRRLGRKELEDPEKAFHEIEGVLHCAGKAGAWGTERDYYESNVLLTRALLAAAKKAGVRRFVNLSSPSIYFDYKNQLGLTEDYVPPRFSNSYAKTKYQAELEVRAAHSKEFETVSLRPRGVIGAGDTNWLPRLIELRKNNALKQVGAGETLANFTSISNLLDAITLAFEAPASAMGETYNIHNGVDEVFWTVVEEGLKECGLDSRRKRIPLPVAMGLARANEILHKVLRSKKEPDLLPVKVGVSAYSMTMDLSKAKARLGYEPRQTTQQALKEFAIWNGSRSS